MRHLMLYRSSDMVILVLLFIFGFYMYDGFSNSCVPSIASTVDFFRPMSCFGTKGDGSSSLYSILFSINTIMFVVCLIFYSTMEIFPRSRNVQRICLVAVVVLYIICMTVSDSLRGVNNEFGVCISGTGILMVYILTGLRIEWILALAVVTFVIQGVSAYLVGQHYVLAGLEMAVYSMFHVCGGLLYYRTYTLGVDSLYTELFSFQAMRYFPGIVELERDVVSRLAKEVYSYKKLQKLDIRVLASHVRCHVPTQKQQRPEATTVAEEPGRLSATFQHCLRMSDSGTINPVKNSMFSGCSRFPTYPLMTTRGREYPSPAAHWVKGFRSLSADCDLLLARRGKAPSDGTIETRMLLDGRADGCRSDSVRSAEQEAGAEVGSNCHEENKNLSVTELPLSPHAVAVDPEREVALADVFVAINQEGFNQGSLVPPLDAAIRLSHQTFLPCAVASINETVDSTRTRDAARKLSEGDGEPLTSIFQRKIQLSECMGSFCDNTDLETGTSYEGSWQRSSQCPSTSSRAPTGFSIGRWLRSVGLSRRREHCEDACWPRLKAKRSPSVSSCKTIESADKALHSCLLKQLALAHQNATLTEATAYRYLGHFGTATTNPLWKRMIRSLAPFLRRENVVLGKATHPTHGFYGYLPFQRPFDDSLGKAHHTAFGSPWNLYPLDDDLEDDKDDDFRHCYTAVGGCPRSQPCSQKQLYDHIDSIFLTSSLNASKDAERDRLSDVQSQFRSASTGLALAAHPEGCSGETPTSQKLSKSDDGNEEVVSRNPTRSYCTANAATLCTDVRQGPDERPSDHGLSEDCFGHHSYCRCSALGGAEHHEGCGCATQQPYRTTETDVCEGVTATSAAQANGHDVTQQQRIPFWGATGFAGESHIGNKADTVSEVERSTASLHDAFSLALSRRNLLEALCMPPTLNAVGQKAFPCLNRIGRHRGSHRARCRHTDGLVSASDPRTSKTEQLRNRRCRIDCTEETAVKSSFARQYCLPGAEDEWVSDAEHKHFGRDSKCLVDFIRHNGKESDKIGLGDLTDSEDSTFSAVPKSNESDILDIADAYAGRPGDWWNRVWEIIMPRWLLVLHYCVNGVWMVTKFFGIHSILHVLLCSSFVLNLVSWEEKPAMPRQKSVSQVFVNPCYEKWFWDWDRGFAYNSRHMLIFVQLIGTLLNAALMGVTTFSLACGADCPRITLIQYIFGIQQPFAREATRATAILPGGLDAGPSSRSAFYSTTMCIVFVIAELVLIFPQLLDYKIGHYAVNQALATLLGIERFALSLFNLSVYAKLNRNDVDVYGQVVLNVLLAPLWVSLSSVTRNVLFLVVTGSANAAFLLSVNHSHATPLWRTQIVRMNVTLVYIWMILYLFYSRASEDCRRRLFCLACLPYLIELSRLTGPAAPGAFSATMPENNNTSLTGYDDSDGGESSFQNPAGSSEYGGENLHPIKTEDHKLKRKQKNDSNCKVTVSASDASCGADVYIALRREAAALDVEHGNYSREEGQRRDDHAECYSDNGIADIPEFIKSCRYCKHSRCPWTMTKGEPGVCICPYVSPRGELEGYENRSVSLLSRVRSHAEMRRLGLLQDYTIPAHHDRSNVFNGQPLMSSRSLQTEWQEEDIRVHVECDGSIPTCYVRENSRNQPFNFTVDEQNLNSFWSQVPVKEVDASHCCERYVVKHRRPPDT